jgi:hypothetical protein
VFPPGTLSADRRLSYWLRVAILIYVVVRGRYPLLSKRFATHPWSWRLASGLDRLQKVSA